MEKAYLRSIWQKVRNDPFHSRIDFYRNICYIELTICWIYILKVGTIIQTESRQKTEISAFSNEKPELIPISKEMIHNGAKMMAKAFFNYPLYQYFFPNEKSRLRRCYHYFFALINYGRLFGHAVATSYDCEGLGIWMPSESARFTTWNVIKSGIPLRFALAGFRFLFRLNKSEPYQYRIYKKNAPIPNNYLMLLAVHPDHQGQGYAGKILSHIIKATEEEQKPLYLETYLPRNVHI